MGEERDPRTRAHPRFGVAWRVTWKCGDWKSAAHVAAANFSRGGMFLRSEQPPDVGTPVELTIELPNGMRLHVVGTVRHVVDAARARVEGRAPGAGVTFEEASEADLAVLEYVASTEGVNALAKKPAVGRLAQGTLDNLPNRATEAPATEYLFTRRKRPKTE